MNDSKKIISVSKDIGMGCYACSVTGLNYDVHDHFIYTIEVIRNDKKRTYRYCTKHAGKFAKKHGLTLPEYIDSNTQKEIKDRAKQIKERYVPPKMGGTTTNDLLLLDEKGIKEINQPKLINTMGQTIIKANQPVPEEIMKKILDLFYQQSNNLDFSFTIKDLKDKFNIAGLGINKFINQLVYSKTIYFDSNFQKYKLVTIEEKVLDKEKKLEHYSLHIDLDIKGKSTFDYSVFEDIKRVFKEKGMEVNIIRTSTIWTP